MIKRIVTAIALTAVALTACGNDPGDGILNVYDVNEVDTPYGPYVCIEWSGINKGGLSCHPIETTSYDP